MPGTLVQSFAADVRSSDRGWSLSSARFDATTDGSAPSPFHLAIDVSESGVESFISFATPSVVPSLERAGYSVRSVESASAFVAVRSLRGLREVSAEAERLTLLVGDEASVSAWPRRAALASKPAPRAAFSDEVFANLSELEGWSCMALAASRKGAPTFADASQWAALAWCTLVIEDDESRFDVGVQLYPREALSPRKAPAPRKPAKPAGAKTQSLGQVQRLLAQRLGTLGYAPVALSPSEREPVAFCVVARTLPKASVASARAERARIDRLLFDSPGA